MQKLVHPKTGEEHGLVNQLANSNTGDPLKAFKGDDKVKAEKAYKEDNRIVKARYLNKRGPNERLDKHYCRWSGDPMQIWHCIPNEVYEVPLGLVNEINQTELVQRSEVLDASGQPTKMEGQSLKIHEFVPISF